VSSLRQWITGSALKCSLAVLHTFPWVIRTLADILQPEKSEIRAALMEEDATLTCPQCFRKIVSGQKVRFIAPTSSRAPEGVMVLYSRPRRWVACVGPNCKDNGDRPWSYDGIWQVREDGRRGVLACENLSRPHIFAEVTGLPRLDQKLATNVVRLPARGKLIERTKFLELPPLEKYRGRRY